MSTSVDIDIKQLLEAGSHFGHKTSRWHPKMAEYIHSTRGGIHIIDLVKTVDALESALEQIELVVARGQQVLLVGTKRQSKDVVKAAAEATGMPYVVNRWLGGMLTNKATISGRIKRLKDLETKMASGELAAKYNKLEVQRFQEEIDRMNYHFAGIKDMTGDPGIVVVADMINNKNAIEEAHRLNVPVVAICDTNADPSKVKYPIPANDDAIKSLQLIIGYIQSAIEAGMAKRKAAPVAAPAEAPAEK